MFKARFLLQIPVALHHHHRHHRVHRPAPFLDRRDPGRGVAGLKDVVAADPDTTPAPRGAASLSRAPLDLRGARQAALASLVRQGRRQQEPVRALGIETPEIRIQTPLHSAHAYCSPWKSSRIKRPLEEVPFENSKISIREPCAGSCHMCMCVYIYIYIYTL